MNKDNLIKESFLSQKTSNPIMSTINRSWYFCDLNGKVIGREAVKIVNILRGKNHKDFISNFDLGNYVVLVNSSKAILTGDKSLKKYYDHSGYPGGLRERSAEVMLSKYPNELVYRIIRGMMPHSNLSRRQLTRIFIYSDEKHPHRSQAGHFLVIN